MQNNGPPSAKPVIFERVVLFGPAVSSRGTGRRVTSLPRVLKAHLTLIGYRDREGNHKKAIDRIKNFRAARVRLRRLDWIHTLIWNASAGHLHHYASYAVRRRLARIVISMFSLCTFKL